MACLVGRAPRIHMRCASQSLELPLLSLRTPLTARLARLKSWKTKNKKRPLLLVAVAFASSCANMDGENPRKAPKAKLQSGRFREALLSARRLVKENLRTGELQISCFQPLQASSCSTPCSAYLSKRVRIVNVLEASLFQPPVLSTASITIRPSLLGWRLSCSTGSCSFTVNVLFGRV